MSEAIAFISFDSFVYGEQSSERRHELVGGAPTPLPADQSATTSQPG